VQGVRTNSVLTDWTKWQPLLCTAWCPVKHVCFEALSCDCVLELAQGHRNKPEAGALASDMCLDAAEAHSADARGASASNRRFYRRLNPFCDSSRHGPVL